MFSIPTLDSLIYFLLLITFLYIGILCFKIAFDIHTRQVIHIPTLIAQILFFVVLLGSSFLLTEERNEEIEIVKQEFTGYLDGKEIDLKNVNILQYDATYDYEEKKVYLTEDKEDSNFIFVPIIR